MDLFGLLLILIIVLGPPYVFFRFVFFRLRKKKIKINEEDVKASIALPILFGSTSGIGSTVFLVVELMAPTSPEVIYLLFFYPIFFIVSVISGYLIGLVVSLILEHVFKITIIKRQILILLIILSIFLIFIFGVLVPWGAIENAIEYYKK